MSMCVMQNNGNGNDNVQSIAQFLSVEVVSFRIEIPDNYHSINIIIVNTDSVFPKYIRCIGTFSLE